MSKLHAVVTRRKRLRRLGVAHHGRVEQQHGELGGVGEGALKGAVDAVELPHHAGNGHVVAEGQEHGRQARAGRAVDRQRDAQAHDVGEHVHRGRDHIDPQILVVPRPLGLGAEVAYVAGVDSRLVCLHGKRPHGIGVPDRVGDVSGQHVRGGFARLDQPLPETDQGQHHHHGRGEHAKQHRHQKRRVAPEHHAYKHQRDQVRCDRVAQHVEHVFEAARIAERTLGERAGEVVVEERHVLGQQFLDGLDVQRLHGANLGARQ